jgi:hypothetical protein
MLIKRIKFEHEEEISKGKPRLISEIFKISQFKQVDQVKEAI